jgi:hypothetical protein
MEGTMSPETREFIAAVRGAEDPTPGDESRVLQALDAALAGAAGGVGAVGGGVPGVAKLAGLSSVGVKLAGALLGVAGAAWLAGAVVAPAFDAATPAASATVRPRDVRAVVPRPAGVPGVSPAPLDVPGGATAPLVVPPAPDGPRSASGDSRVRSATLPSVRDEIALLADVQSALGRGDGAAALDRLDRHVTSDRQFLAERRAARILALCALGRTDEARRGAAVFARAHAGSVQRGALERSCAGDEFESER